MQNNLTDEQFNKLLAVFMQGFGTLNHHIERLVEAMADTSQTMRQMAIAANPAPNYRKPLADYWAFDWAKIGATPLNFDEDGVAAVEWNGRQFTRRSPQNKFDEAIWFSRAIGKDDDGVTNRYEKLITFKDAANAEEIPNKVKKAASGAISGLGKKDTPTSMNGLSQRKISEPEQRALAFVEAKEVKVFGEPGHYTWRVGSAGSDQEVWKDGKVRQCGCAELRSMRQRNPKADCPHILAVALFYQQGVNGQAAAAQP